MTSPAYAAVASLPCTPSHRASVVCSFLIGHLLHCVVVATYSVRTVMRIPRQEQRERHRPRWTSVESPWWSNSRPIQLFWVHRVFCPGAGLCIFYEVVVFRLAHRWLGSLALAESGSLSSVAKLPLCFVAILLLVLLPLALWCVSDWLYVRAAVSCV